MARDDDHEERVARTAARFAKEQALLDEIDARAALEKSARDNAAAELQAKAALALANARRVSAAPRSRTKYEGPDPERASRGNFVSKEELADFQRKNPGATLRDLLNADQGLTRRGSPPPATEAMRSRGVQGANIAPKPPAGSGRGPAAGRTASDMYTDYNLRSLLGTTAPEDKKDPLQRIADRQPSKSPEEERDEAKNRTLAALSLMGGLGTNLAGRAIAARMAAPASRAPASRGPLVKDEDLIPAFKKGGKVKAYAKGGSVKGAGCEQRGLRKCKVY